MLTSNRAHFVFTLLLGFVASVASYAENAYIGSDAEGKAVLYKVSFTTAGDTTIAPFAELPRTPGAQFSAVALKPGTNQLYCVIGPQITVVDIATKEQRTLEVPTFKPIFFNTPFFFSPSGNLLYVVALTEKGEKGLVMKSDSLEVLATYQARNHGGYLRAVSFDAEESCLLIGVKNAIIKAPLSGEFDLEREPQGGLETETQVNGVPCGLGLRGNKVQALLSNDESGEPGALKAHFAAPGQQPEFVLRGHLLHGWPEHRGYCSYNASSETLFIQQNNGTLEKSIPVSLTHLLGESDVSVSADPETGEMRYKLAGGRIERLPVFNKGAATADARFVLLANGDGISVPSYITVVDVNTGEAAPAKRIGASGGGVTNIVLVP